MPPVNGTAFSSNQFIPLEISPGSNSTIDVLISIDETVSLGTEVTVTKYVIGGESESPQQSEEKLIFSITEMRALSLGNPPLSSIEMGPSSSDTTRATAETTQTLRKSRFITPLLAHQNLAAKKLQKNLIFPLALLLHHL